MSHIDRFNADCSLDYLRVKHMLGKKKKKLQSVNQHHISLHDAHLCPLSTPFQTRRRSSWVRAQCPRWISSAPCLWRETSRLLNLHASCVFVLPDNSVSPGDKAPATRDVEHLYSGFQVPRRVDERRGCREHAQCLQGREGLGDTHWRWDDVKNKTTSPHLHQSLVFRLSDYVKALWCIIIIKKVRLFERKSYIQFRNIIINKHQKLHFLKAGKGGLSE